MPNEKFTQLPTVPNAMLTDIICAVQTGTSVQETLSQVQQLMLSNTILSFAGNPNGNLAGSIYQLCWDTTDNILYVCTTTGTSSTAVWTQAIAGGFTWINVTGTSQLMAKNTGYIANNSSLVTFTLPATSNIGDIISVVGAGVGGWTIIENSGQNIQVGSVSSTTTSGSISSINQYDSIDLICIVANTTWVTRGGPQGNITIV